MDLTFLCKGLILGFSVAAPVGPIGALCINRTINKGYISGFVSGLGAATADLIYGTIAGLGLTIISEFLLDYKFPIQAVGLVFLAYTGIKTLLKKHDEFEYKRFVTKDLFSDYLTTFFLTITNPITILFFIAVFSGLGLSVSENNKIDSLPLILGVFLGSGAWWLFLSGLTHKIKNKINHKILKQIDLLSGIIILAFAVYLAINLIVEFNG